MNPASPDAPLHTPLCSGEPHVDADRHLIRRLFLADPVRPVCPIEPRILEFTRL
jgi:hypothetical protein